VGKVAILRPRPPRSVRVMARDWSVRSRAEWGIGLGIRSGGRVFGFETGGGYLLWDRVQ
jgi:hypothetical protein